MSAEEFTRSENSDELLNTSPDLFISKMKSITNLKDLLLNYNISWDSPDFKNHKLFKEKGFKNYRGKLGIDDVLFNYVVRVGKAKTGNFFYDIDLEVDQYLPHTNSASDIKVSTSIEDDDSTIDSDSQDQKQKKDRTADVDTNVLLSLEEANKQLTVELGKSKVTAEKILERAEKLADKRKAKSDQKIKELKQLVKLQGVVNAYSRGSLDAIASQLIKYSGAENVDKDKLINKLQTYYGWLTNYGLKSEDMQEAISQAQTRIASSLMGEYGDTEEELIRAEAASQDLAEKVIDLYWNALPVTTVASKNAQKLAETKQKDSRIWKYARRT